MVAQTQKIKIMKTFKIFSGSCRGDRHVNIVNFVFSNKVNCTVSYPEWTYCEVCRQYTAQIEVNEDDFNDKWKKRHLS